jgi:peptide/nickel transport system substrate-binding protein
MNTTTPPWDDIHVRKAIAHSVDYAGLVQAVLGGHGQVATAMTPPQQFVELMAKDEVTALYSELGWEFDLDMARAELAQSSVPNGFQAEMTYADSQQPQGAVALNLSENLKEIGIELEVRERPFLEELAEVFGPHPGPLYVVQWTAVSGDPAELPGLMFDSQYAHEGGFNFTFYNNPEMDELLNNQRTAEDPATRAGYLTDVLRLANRDVFQVPVFYEDHAMGINSRLTYDGFSAWIRYFSWPERFAAR